MKTKRSRKTITSDIDRYYNDCDDYIVEFSCL